MDRARLRKVRALRFGLLLPVLLLVAFPAVAQAPGKPKVDRLVMGLITPYLDYVRPWINGTADHNIQHDPMLEWLVEVDAETGQYKPWLADSWTLGPNGRSWKVKLHKGVQFHHGYGEFTAQDVVHSHALWCDPNYPGRKDLPVSGYRAGICQVQKIEVVSAHEITMHCKVVCLDMPFYYSSASNVMIFSKKQWDAEGEMGYERKPAGTGPYIFKERQLSRYVLYERAPTPHWKHGVVDWKEIKMTWTIEEATRFAQLIAGETHLTEVNKDLTDELVGKGYKLVRSRGTAQQMQINFGGLYFGTEDKATGRYTEYGGTTGKLDPKLPWANVKVRQAMNKAINRNELLKVLYKGRANPMYVHGFYPDLEGWDPTWEKRFPAMYGYDPAAAKRLLAEAGYPKGFKAKAWLYPFAGAPEMVAVMEAAALQLREVEPAAISGRSPPRRRQSSRSSLSSTSVRASDISFRRTRSTRCGKTFCRSPMRRPGMPYSSRSSWTPRSSRTGLFQVGTGAMSATPGESWRVNGTSPARSSGEEPLLGAVAEPTSAAVGASPQALGSSSAR